MGASAAVAAAAARPGRRGGRPGRARAVDGARGRGGRGRRPADGRARRAARLGHPAHPPRRLPLPARGVAVGRPVGAHDRRARARRPARSCTRARARPLEATLAASFGVSLAVQFAVFNARVARDGRPIRPARRRGATAPGPHSPGERSAAGGRHACCWLPVILLSAYVSDSAARPTLPAAVAAVAGWAGVGGRRCAPGPTAVAGPDRHRGAGRGRGRLFMAAGGGWSSRAGLLLLRGGGGGHPAARARRRSAVLVGTVVGVALVLAPAPARPRSLALLGLAGVLLLGMGRRESVRREEQRELQLVNAARAAGGARPRGGTRRTRPDRPRRARRPRALALRARRPAAGRAAHAAARRRDPPTPSRRSSARSSWRPKGLAEARRAVTALRDRPRSTSPTGLRALVADTPVADLEIDGVAELSADRAGDRAPHRAGGSDERARARRGRAGLGAPAPPRRRRPSWRSATARARRRPRPAGGYGLVGMAERAALVGADLDAGPVEDGWRVAPAAAARVAAVVLADDQTIVREGLVTLLGLLPGIEVVGAAADGAQRGRPRRRARPGRAAHRPADARAATAWRPPSGPRLASRDRGRRAHDLRRRRRRCSTRCGPGRPAGSPRTPTPRPSAARCARPRPASPPWIGALARLLAAERRRRSRTKRVPEAEASTAREVGGAAADRGGAVEHRDRPARSW